ncbi:polysaccharide pyruvyl transferase family protein [Pseudarthrobacter sp. NBSH8]|uniref:polysaccharide pyruvyl transferase family protein n=1 Tax=Pseudarthrobacter sp. NBSH8 TaxID=2596911 RepID=UPI001624D395|nr:polysaccharide pyruvyl transferase family protein [Pseudarthrobacter sp. NBSH8]QNE15588.1 hypothetical protein FYJ92_15015 [Pseudarthrobacter sp. NBSH8]
MDYIDFMKDEAVSAFDRIFDGIKEVVLTDFPDHENVGDSAIALGELEYFRTRAIEVTKIYCVGTLYRGVYASEIPVVIHGGGNFGGLYPAVENHRYSMARNLSADTPLIQAPQSVHFVDDVSRQNFITHLADRRNFRMGVRDNYSSSKIVDSLPDHIISPDAVHLLGQIQAASPTQSTVILARTDGESAANREAVRKFGSVDWLEDYPWTRRQTLLRWKYRYLGRVGDWLNPNPARWEAIAQGRMDRGVGILATGETIVTDRLHAMLIGLQMGRQVIAIDNNNQKLSSYADTWFGAANPDVRFVKSFEDAMDVVGMN